MSYYNPFTLTTIEPGAAERIAERLKDLPKINKERPCIRCLHWDKNRVVKCLLPFGKCDFHHSAFIETRLNENLEESDNKNN